MSAEECVFCRVVDGTVESSRVYEDDEVLAFMDIQPVTDGHLLVIPKRHASDLADLDEQLGMSMFRIDADWRERPRAELDDAAERIRGGMGASAT